MAIRYLLRSVVGILCLVSLAACGSNTPATQEIYTRVSEATLKAGDAIPAPSSDVIVTITGKIGTTNGAESIQMDRATLDAVGLVDYTVSDPFENKDITYRGVLMSDLLALWQVPSDATSLHIVALNDYSIEVPMEHFSLYPVIFAMQADGVDMPISTQGPAMLVYPYNHFEALNPAIYNDFWIWQIKSIEVR